jgi:hypothetical protein
MMNREQRIDYEMLDFALNASRDANGYPTAVPAFLIRLRKLFPNVVASEFTDACKRLFTRNALHLRRFDNDLAAFRDYQDACDDVTFFGAGSNGFCLRASEQSQNCFKQLSALIDVPVGVSWNPLMIGRPGRCK